MTVTIEKIVPGGDGMGRVDGKVVFVPMALPGETHRVRTIRDKKGFIRAESEELLNASDSGIVRTDPFCPLYGKCGGCNMQHMSYEDERKVKVQMVMDSLERQGGEVVASSLKTVPDIIPSPHKAYRNRAQFHHRGDSIGFRSRSSHDLVPLDGCPLLAGGINRFLSDHKVGDLPPVERFTLFGTEEDCWIEGLHKRIETTLLEKTIAFAPELFFQSNLTLFPALMKDVLEFAGQGDSFLDLYSGVGVFALFLEDNFSRGTAVESSRGALRFARMNLKKTDFFEEPVEKWVGTNRDDAPDFLVVDPPRTGLSRTARDFILSVKPEKFSYVSCDPVTQARDLRILLEGGFALEQYRLYDFYPHTSHLEGVAHLVRGK